MENLKEKIQEFENRGFYVGGEFNDVVYTEKGVYEMNPLSSDCPLCSQYMEDNGFEETICSHDEEVLKDLEEARVYYKLISEKKRIELVGLYLKS